MFNKDFTVTITENGGRFKGKPFTAMLTFADQKYCGKSYTRTEEFSSRTAYGAAKKAAQFMLSIPQSRAA